MRDPAARRPRPHLRAARRHRLHALGRLPRRPCATSSASGSSSASVTRSTPRSTARSPRSCRRADPVAAWSPTKLHFLGALPRIDGDAARTTTSATASTTSSTRGQRGLDGPAGPQAAAAARARSPSRRSARTPAGAELPGALLLGIDEKELAPLGLDLDAEPHLLRLRRRPVRQERPAAHRTCHEIMRTRTPKEAQIVRRRLPARSLLGEVPDDYLAQLPHHRHPGPPAVEDIAGLPPAPASRAPT